MGKKKNKSYTLKIKSLKKKGWHDMDTVMLHASFQCLKDCVEKEDLFGNRGEIVPEFAGGEDFTESTNREIARELYNWWNDRIVKSKEMDIDTIKQYEEDTQKLIELIKVREFLWT